MGNTQRQEAIRIFSDAMIAMRAIERSEQTAVPSVCAVTPAQGMVVHEIARESGVTTKDIARRLSISSSAVTQLVNVLEADDIVRRLADPSDGRKSRLELTEYGTRLYEQFDRARLSGASALLDPLEDDEVAEVARLLNKITGVRPGSRERGVMICPF